MGCCGIWKRSASTLPPWPSWVWEDDLLSGIGRLVREYHEVVASFEPPGR
jgi:hypothetical protein